MSKVNYIEKSRLSYFRIYLPYLLDRPRLGIENFSKINIKTTVIF